MTPSYHPIASPARQAASRSEENGLGFADAVLRIVMEKRRFEDDRHADVIERELEPGAFTLGQAAVACAVGSLEMRLPQHPWRSAHPTPAVRCDAVRMRPTRAATDPSTL